MSTKAKYEMEINRLKIQRDEIMDELVETEDETAYAELLGAYNKVYYELKRLEGFYNRFLKEA